MVPLSHTFLGPLTEEFEGLDVGGHDQEAAACYDRTCQRIVLHHPVRDESERRDRKGQVGMRPRACMVRGKSVKCEV